MYTNGGRGSQITKIIDSVRSCTRAFLQKVHETLQPSAGSPLLVDRRRETRTSRISPCTFSLERSSTPSPGLLEEGRCTAVNDSPTGMRLLLSVAPVEGQILEIQTGDLTIGRSISLVEVCWTKPLVYEKREMLYLVGCRVSFGPMRQETI